jgi:hypothetical protein
MNFALSVVRTMSGIALKITGAAAHAKAKAHCREQPPGNISAGLGPRRQ